MAKKSKESGPGVFMIITLVFFVLAAVILGVTTYLGFEDATKWENEAASAREKEKLAAKNAAEQTLRRNVLRIAIGNQEPEDFVELSGGAKEHNAAILDEYNKLTSKLGPGAFPTDTAFKWGLMTELAKPDGGNLDSDPKPAVAPNKTIPAIVKIWEEMYKAEATKNKAEEAARIKAQDNVKVAQADAEKAKEIYNQQVADLTKQVKDKIDAMDKAFVTLKADADKAGIDFKNTANVWAEEKAKLEEAQRLLVNDKRSLEDKVKNLQNPDASDIEFKFRHWDVAKTAEHMGTVSAKSGKFVNLSFRNAVNLVPGQTFVVIAPTGSLVEVLEREKALEKHHHAVVSLGPRDPFADNEMVKGTVEIVDVTNKYAARARITHEASEVRNPIGKGDQLFNISLSTGQKEHVAFAGIIDLDGDGRPNNEEFVRILEKNNLVIDAYLDLKNGEIIKRGGTGMDHKTKFLILGTDAPLVANVRRMVDEADKKGIQVIDGRKFLNLIGVKPPARPARPEYPSANLGPAGEINPKR